MLEWFLWYKWDYRLTLVHNKFNRYDFAKHRMEIYQDAWKGKIYLHAHL